MSYIQLKQRLDAGDVIVLDGGTGTELERRGVPMSPEAWCGPATLGNAELLTQIHLDYINAGSDVITANTYAANSMMLTPAGADDDYTTAITLKSLADGSTLTRSGKGLVNAALAQVHADGELAQLEQHGGHCGAHPHVMPFQAHRGHELENHREQHGGGAYRNEGVQGLQRHLPGRPQAAGPAAQGRHPCADDQGHDEQKGQPQDQPEGQHPRAQHGP